MKGKIKCSGEEVDKVTHWMILVANYKLNPVPGTQKQKISWVKQRHCISMAMAFETTHFLLSRPTASTSTLFLFSSNLTRPKPASLPSRFFHCRSKRLVLTPRFAVKACAVNVEEKNVAAISGEWGKVSAVLFDMDGVLCNSEEPSRRAGVDLFAEMGVDVTVDDFVPFMGTGTSLVFWILFCALSAIIYLNVISKARIA